MIDPRVQVAIQIASRSRWLPTSAAVIRWATAAVNGHREQAEISLRIVDADEAAMLNQRWRRKAGPTNVLAFPADLPGELALPLLGDLVICAPVVEQECQQQGKTREAHWAHMVVHGTLHLLGYDHVEAQQASVMEALETQILAGLGYPDPYAHPIG